MHLLQLHFTSLNHLWMKEGRKPAYPEKTPINELQKMPHRLKSKPQPRLEHGLRWWQAFSWKADILPLHNAPLETVLLPPHKNVRLVKQQNATNKTHENGEWHTWHRSTSIADFWSASHSYLPRLACFLEVTPQNSSEPVIHTKTNTQPHLHFKQHFVHFTVSPLQQLTSSINMHNLLA